MKYAQGAPHLKTCPWYYLHDPTVQVAQSLALDFDAGRLGPIWDMPAPLVDVLHAMSEENKRWQAAADEALLT